MITWHGPQTGLQAELNQQQTFLQGIKFIKNGEWKKEKEKEKNINN